MMDIPKMDAGKGHLELMLLNSRAVESTEDEFFSRLHRRSMPKGLENEFRRMWNETRVCGGQLIHIGRVILEELAGFVESHPYDDSGESMAAGVAAMLEQIPFLEPILGSSAKALAHCGYGKDHFARSDKEELMAQARTSLKQFAVVMHGNKAFFPVLNDMSPDTDSFDEYALDLLAADANPFALDDAVPLTKETKTIVRFLIKVAQAEGAFDDSERQFIRRTVKDRKEAVSDMHLDELAAEVSQATLEAVLGPTEGMTDVFKEHLIFLAVITVTSDRVVDVAEKKILSEALSLLGISRKRYSEIAREAMLARKASQEEGFLSPETRLLVKYLIKMGRAEASFDVTEKLFIRRVAREEGEHLTEDVFQELIKEVWDQSTSTVLAEAENYPREYKEKLLLMGMLMAAADKSVNLWEKRILVDTMTQLGVSKERYGEIAQEAHARITK